MRHTRKVAKERIVHAIFANPFNVAAAQLLPRIFKEVNKKKSFQFISKHTSLIVCNGFYSFPVAKIHFDEVDLFIFYHVWPD